MIRRPASARRGEPILALVVILLVWTVARAAMWNPIFAGTDPRSAVNSHRIASAAGVSSMSEGLGPSAMIRPTAASRKMARAKSPIMHRRERQVSNGVEASSFVLVPRANAHAATHPPNVLNASSSPAKKATRMRDQRWSFDRWLLLRAGSGDAAQVLGAASYGASQAGAVARFRLGKGQQADSYGYLRTSLAINAPGKDKELALGFGIRPVRQLPLRVLAEARLYDSKGSPVRVRPVVTVVTELPWQNLGGGIRVETYGQAGFAGGVDSTAFFDAQMVVDHSIAKAIGVRRDVRVGTGVWAGGQKGAVRLDMGPRVSMPVNLGDGVPSRIALDWRMRVTGNARPASGPALTIASSF